MTSALTLLVNPTAGRGRGARVADRVESYLEAAGVHVVRLQGTDGPHASRLAAAAVEADTDALVVVGGDGMVHLALQALAGSRVPLGVVPAGTGNDTARALGLSVSRPLRAVDAVLAGHRRVLDLADVQGTRFATVLAAGFDAAVNERANRLRGPGGRIRYTAATLAELRVLTPRRYVLDLAGRRIERDAVLVAVGNGPSYGGGLRICEGADLADGLLDVVVVAPLRRLALLRLFPRLFDGSHVGAAAYQRFRVPWVQVGTTGVTAYADGERLGPLPLRVDALPAAVEVFAPPPAPVRTLRS